MNEQIVPTLLEFYKEKGIDLYALLDDPLFVSMPLPEKVKAIQTHAHAIRSGTVKGVSSQNLKSILLDAAATGLVTGAASGLGIKEAYKFFAPGQAKPSYLPLIGGIALGGLIGAGNAIVNATKITNQKNQVLNKLHEVEKNPSDVNALKLLMLRNSQVSPNANIINKSNILDTVVNSLRKVPFTLATKNIPAYVEYSTLSDNYVRGVPSAPDDIMDAKVRNTIERTFERPSLDSLIGK